MLKTAEFLKQNDNYLILTHRRPDGDTCGSAAALCLALRKLGKRAFVCENEDITQRLAPFTAELYPPKDFSPGVTVAVDIADEKLFCASMERYKGKVDLCIDHHPTNTRYAERLLLREKEAATGVIVAELIDALGVSADERIYENIYLAVATDTGCFKYSNTTPAAHRTAALCMEAGVDFHRLNTVFFVVKSRARMALERELFDKMKVYLNGKLCASLISRDFIERTGADNDDLDNLSSLMMELDTALCGILLTENRQRGSYKVSVRTRKPVSASAICARLGGGGHDRAAGASIEGAPVQALNALVEAAKKEILC